jgi:hypothetical protein
MRKRKGWLTGNELHQRLLWMIVDKNGVPVVVIGTDRRGRERKKNSKFVV